MNLTPRPHLQNIDGAVVLLQENGKSKKKYQHTLHKQFQTAKNCSNRNKQTRGIGVAASE